MKPVEMDSTLLKVLPKEFQGCACSKCAKLHSRWSIHIPDVDNVPVCSLCLMYEFPWGKKREEDLKNFIVEVEGRLGKQMEKTEDGRLTSPEDADRIIGAIVMTSRIFQVRRKFEFHG